MEISTFPVKYFLEILSERKVFAEENPVIAFLQTKFDFESDDFETALEKVQFCIPTWIKTLHIELCCDGCLVECIAKLEKEIFEKCKKTEFTVDLRKIV